MYEFILLELIDTVDYDLFAFASNCIDKSRVLITVEYDKFGFLLVYGCVLKIVNRGN